MPLTIPMKFTLCLSLLLTGLQVHCHHVPGHHEELEHNGEPNPPEPQQQPLEEGQGTEPTRLKISKINADFLFRLYNLITSDPVPKNVFFSPLSITTAFALLTLGAKNDTHHQIFNRLGFSLSDIEESEIHGAFKRIIHTLNQPNNVTQMNIGNALFMEETLPLQPKFQNDVITFYEAEGIPTNFKNSTAAEDDINNHVKNKTNGKITEAVQGLDPNTLMVLVNYVYFKAPWKNPFDPELTRETDFFVDATTTVKVNMMYREGYYDYLYDDFLHYWVVRVPYNEEYSAWIILPDQGKMKAVEDALSTELFLKWEPAMKHEEIQLYLPKFSISGSYDVKDLMKKQGMNDVFDDRADLSGITGHRNLRVSKAVHKAELDVQEGGTEAAAVTVLEFVYYSGRIFTPPVIKCNRPFLMLITNEPLHHFIFMAKVMNPAVK